MSIWNKYGARTWFNYVVPGLDSYTSSFSVFSRYDPNPWATGANTVVFGGYSASFVLHRGSGGTNRFSGVVRGNNTLIVTLNSGTNSGSAPGNGTVRWAAFGLTHNADTSASFMMHTSSNGFHTHSGNTVGATMPFQKLQIGGCDGNSNYSLGVSGSYGDTAYWQCVLTSDELYALMRGASPMTIRPESLKFYVSLANTSSMSCMVSGATASFDVPASASWWLNDTSKHCVRFGP